MTSETTRRADEILARTLRRVEIFGDAGDDWPFAPASSRSVRTRPKSTRDGRSWS